MAIDAFNVSLNFGGAKLVEGKQYTVELTGLVIKEKVVAGSTNLAKKGVIGKEYESLTPDQKRIVDESPIEFWPAKKEGESPKEKSKFINRIVFEFTEPETNTKFPYDVQFDMTYPDNFPMKTKNSDLRGFVQRVFGMPIQGDEGFVWGDIFKRGDKFVATTYRKDGYSHINSDSIIKSELAGPAMVKDEASLSADAKNLLNFIKDNLVGKKFTEVIAHFPDGGNGAVGSADDPTTYNRTHAAWNEIRQSDVRYSLDGKVFGF